MSLTKQKRNEIKLFIQWNISKHPRDIARFTQQKYSLSRTAILNYLSALNRENKIKIEGTTRNRKYSLIPLANFKQTYQLKGNLAEDKVWRNDIAPLFTGVKDNVLAICHYGFTEIFNNAIDHSEGTTIEILVNIWINYILICVTDNGVGIFNKIQKKYNLDDPSHAILELAKGKMTTEPDSHTGEGIFFTSRMFDIFAIESGKYSFASQQVDTLFEADKYTEGTSVFMMIAQDSEQTTENVFAEFTNPNTLGFDKTIVPVKLSRYGNENLISRSQAKRLMARLEKFKTVVLDFDNIENIGRAFADEIFRVFVNNHPGTLVLTINDNQTIQQLVKEIQNSSEQ